MGAGREGEGDGRGDSGGENVDYEERTYKDEGRRWKLARKESVKEERKKLGDMRERERETMAMKRKETHERIGRWRELRREGD